MSMVDAGISQVLDGIWGSALPRCDRRFLCGQAVAASRLGGDGRAGVPADHGGEGAGVLQLFEGLMLQAKSAVGRPIGLGQVRGLLLAAGRRDLVSRLTEVNRARRAIAHPDVGLAGLVRDALAAAVVLHGVGDDIDEVFCVSAEGVAQETKQCFEGEALCDLVYEPSDVSHGAGRVGHGSWSAGGHAATAAATTGFDEAAASGDSGGPVSGSEPAAASAVMVEASRSPFAGSPADDEASLHDETESRVRGYPKPWQEGSPVEESAVRGQPKPWQEGSPVEENRDEDEKFAAAKQAVELAVEHHRNLGQVKDGAYSAWEAAEIAAQDFGGATQLLTADELYKQYGMVKHEVCLAEAATKAAVDNMAAIAMVRARVRVPVPFDG
jgi:hypothetical protein